MRARTLAAWVVAALGASACRGGDDASTSTTSSSGSSSSVASSSSGAGGSFAPTPVKILDWNVHNFFDDTQSDSPADKVTTAEYTAHKQSVGGVLAAMDADVIVLAEVENQHVLDDLDKEELANKYPFRKLLPGNDPRLVNLGLLAKLMPDQVITHRDERFTKQGTSQPSYEYARDCLEVHFTIAGREVVLLGVHFRSKVAPDDPDKRLAEAQHTRAIADGILAKKPNTPILVLGDYNDTPDSAPVKALLGTSPAFVDAPSNVAPAERWSYAFMGMNELIDHQIASPAMNALLDPKSVVIRHGADVDAASDHAPILATYVVK